MIGKTLQELLNAKKTNVNELAKGINVSAQTLYSIIRRDNMKIDFEVLLKICDYLGVNVEIFYQDYLKFTSKKNVETSCATNLSKNEKKLLSDFKELNDSGQRHLMDTLADMIAGGRYKHDEFTEEGVA